MKVSYLLHSSQFNNCTSLNFFLYLEIRFSLTAHPYEVEIDFNPLDTLLVITDDDSIIDDLNENVDMEVSLHLNEVDQLYLLRILFSKTISLMMNGLRMIT